VVRAVVRDSGGTTATSGDGLVPAVAVEPMGRG
jgi:hypothetical protein